ncbi:MAG TPA: 23S rRNA (adenine(2503)-C(2))-methyltransferase RlmN [Terriglobales bacterium]|jgi:23S rRNA (adenine2503-C2)-methyltransferase|nr:23S rRNA (adenine(2503)-C(2))-methyltransferase RlmN [Terriglobales bacterium]
MPDKPSNPLLGLSLQELTNLAVGSGQPAYRGQQLFNAIYRQKIERLDQASTLPLEYRAQLADEGWTVGLPEIARKFVSNDGTVRYLMTMADGETVETVWMPEGDGGETGDGSEAGDEMESVVAPTWRRSTICVSSQVGCAVNCKFCFTALLGVKRNLEAGEIVGQIAAVLRDQGVEPPLQRVNIVFMGMGEPFLNYDNFMKSVRLLVEGVAIPESRMTVSTAGIVPRIRDFGREPVRPKLAISLNASNDTLRSEVMPLNRKWNLEQLMSAAREFPLRTREKVTFEYVLLAGVNDAPEQAREVVELVRGLRARINLIAMNPGTELPYRTPEQQRVAAFRAILVEAGIPAFVRRPRGRDIFAACGQLKRTVEITPIHASQSQVSS